MFVALMYHLVDESIADPVSISPRAFAEQMRLLRDEGYHALSAAEAAAIAQGTMAPSPEKTASSRAVFITFDDGYANNVEVALPLLAENGLRATLFVITAAMGQLNRWNPKACYDVRHASSDELRTWLAHGGDIGGHSHEHLCMARLHEEEIRSTLETNKRILTESLACSPLAFAYPYGVFTPAVRQQVAQHYALAFSDSAGVWSPVADCYAINRIGVRPEWSLSEFRRRLEVTALLAARAPASRS